jgi:hypothetical protein
VSGAPRLAIRDEKPWVVAYIASEGTMDDAIEIARILRRIVNEDGGLDGQVWQDWKAALSEYLRRFVERLTGKPAPELVEREVPPHEKLQ